MLARADHSRRGAHLVSTFSRNVMLAGKLIAKKFCKRSENFLAETTLVPEFVELRVRSLNKCLKQSRSKLFPPLRLPLARWRGQNHVDIDLVGPELRASMMGQDACFPGWQASAMFLSAPSSRLRLAILPRTSVRCRTAISFTIAQSKSP